MQQQDGVRNGARLVAHGRAQGDAPQAELGEGLAAFEPELLEDVGLFLKVPFGGVGHGRIR